MNLIVVLLGLVTLFMGAVPMLSDKGIMPSSLSFIPVTGMGYQLIIMIIGILMFLYGIKKKYVIPK